LFSLRQLSKNKKEREWQQDYGGGVRHQQTKSGALLVFHVGSFFFLVLFTLIWRRSAFSQRAHGIFHGSYIQYYPPITKEWV
jgi:hypothetical protein